MHGGLEKDNLKIENLNALKKGLPNLKRHIENIKKFGLNLIVAINHFETDTQKEIKIVEKYCFDLDVKVSLCTHWADGGKGTKDLANKVVKLCKDAKDSKFNFIYDEKKTLIDKIETIAREIYRANEIEISDLVKEQLYKIEQAGYSKFPICIAKTQYSFTVDPNLKGAPSGHKLTVREVRLSSGAEFIVVVCGSIMTMPGLPRIPAADKIKLNKKGDIEGLF